MMTLHVTRPETASVISEIATDDPALAPRVAQYLENAVRLQSQANSLKEDGDHTIQAGTFDPALATEIDAIAKTLRDRVADLQGKASSLALSEQLELNELTSRGELSSIVDLLADEIERKRKVAALAQCVSDTTTTAITKKSTELTKSLITQQLQQTFKDELKKVEFTHLDVEIQTAGGAKGALFHKLAFTNAPGIKVTDVLSEGESRALSFAAFITELSTAPTCSSIVFDDPVSSLDHQWREKLGKRLTAEAATRQVIVFTHDLLFLKILLEESANQEVSFQHQYVRRDGQAGLCSSDLPWVAMGIKDRIGVLKTKFQAANALATAGKHDEYEDAARTIYGYLREAWERAVSEILLNNVVERYRPSIETKRVAPLHDITQADCDLVDGAMTAASRWIRGHDEALADGTPFPKAVVLKQQIDELEKWVKTIRERREKKKKSA
jgi:hypothetical protein